jgi:hypothetical protein
LRVCDITREDEVTSAFIILEVRPGDTIESVTSDQGNDAKVIASFETGKRATEAIEKGAWGELNSLLPHSLRQKSQARVEGAAKARATRAAKAAATAEDPLAAPAPASVPTTATPSKK